MSERFRHIPVPSLPTLRLAKQELINAGVPFFDEGVYWGFIDPLSLHNMLNDSTLSAAVIDFVKYEQARLEMEQAMTEVPIKFQSTGVWLWQSLAVTGAIVFGRLA